MMTNNQRTDSAQLNSTKNNELLVKRQKMDSKIAHNSKIMSACALPPMHNCDPNTKDLRRGIISAMSFLNFVGTPIDKRSNYSKL